MKSWLKILLAVLVLVVVGLIGYFAAQQTPIVRTKTITLTVLAQEGNFSIVCMDALQVKAGEDVVFTIDVLPQLGFNKPVQFTVTGGPPGMAVSWQALENQQGDTWYPGRPDPDNLACVLAVPLDNGLVGNWQVTLTGTSVEQ